MSETVKTYYFGGYYLVKLRPAGYGEDPGRFMYTCSECINDPLLDAWSYGWTSDRDKQIDTVKSTFRFSGDQVDEIRDWVNDQYSRGQIGWTSVFMNLETALAYKSRFFAHVSDLAILALYFDPDERTDILEEFKPQSETMGEIGLRLSLLQKTTEQANEAFLGYDYIGIDIGGGFQTFHCYGLAAELSDRFGLSINKYGLFDSDMDSKQVLGYLNEEANNPGQVPWFLAMVKLVPDE